MAEAWSSCPQFCPLWELRTAASAHNGDHSYQRFIDHCLSSWWEHQDCCCFVPHVQNVLDMFVVCISIFLQVPGVLDWTSLSLKWKDLEKQWRCRVKFQGLIWQNTIFTGYDRDQGTLWSGSGGWMQVLTLLTTEALFKVVMWWPKTCPAALSTWRSAAWQLRILLFFSVLEDTVTEEKQKAVQKHPQTISCKYSRGR